MKKEKLAFKTMAFERLTIIVYADDKQFFINEMAKNDEQGRKTFHRIVEAYKNQEAAKAGE